MLRIVCIAVVLLGSLIARADLPDSAWLVVKDRLVIVTLQTGVEIEGTLAAVDPQAVTLVDAHGRVVAIQRADVTGLRVATDEPLRESDRHIGLQTATGPGNVLVDVDTGRLYAYVGASIGYPIIFSGDHTDQYIAGVVGAGGQWRISPTSRWKFDLTGDLIPTYWGGFSIGIGVTGGFHYTSASGFTVGFKIPIIGVAPGYSTLFNKHALINSGALLIANYYLEAAMELPIVSLGYRFK